MCGVFRYANPPVVRWGPGSIAELAGELDRLAVGPVAIVSTRSVAGDPALLDRVRDSLGGRAVTGVRVVRQHAPVADIDEAVAELADGRPEALVSVGGGSPIDAAKVIGVDLAARGGRSRLPHVAVPTTLSVAELGGSAGFTDPEGNKAGRRDAGLLPDAVIYDGELALRTPLELWLATGIRALDHAVEGFLAAGEHPLPDVLAVASVQRLFDSLPRAQATPGDAGVRTENQLAAWFGFTLPGPSASGLSHVMGKQIGARHGIPHGVTSCLLLPHVLRYRAGRGEAARIGELARAAGLGEDADDLAAAIARLVGDLGLPRHLGAFGLTDADLERAAGGLAGQPAEELLEVYRAAW